MSHLHSVRQRANIADSMIVVVVAATVKTAAADAADIETVVGAIFDKLANIVVFTMNSGSVIVGRCCGRF